jgi:hypothetical protein
MRSTKGQGISINMVIIGVIALVVLVVSIAMYMKYVKQSDTALKNCETVGGYCVGTLEACKNADGREITIAKCASTPSAVCCTYPAS